MKLNKFRKLSYSLYSNDLLKNSAPVTGLKRYVRRILNKFFSEESIDFQKSNADLLNLLNGLFSSLKDLENSIKDYDLPTFKILLNQVQFKTNKLNEMLSKLQLDVSKIESSFKEEVKERYYLKQESDLDHNPPISDSLPETKKENELMVKNILPQTQEDSVKSEELVLSEVPDRVIEPVVQVKNDPAKFPRSFNASLLSESYDFKFEASEIEKLESKIRPFFSENSDSSSLGYDVIQAVRKGQIDDWRKVTNKTSPVQYTGSVAFELSGNYLSEPLRLYGVVGLDTVGQILYIYRVKTNAQKRANLNFNIVKMARDLGPNFWEKFNEMSQRLGVQPEVFLPIMYIESGFNPQVSTKGGAAGLIQFLPQILKGTGYQDGIDSFSKLTGEEQLTYIEKFIKSVMSFNGGKPYTDSVTYYVSNFWPDALNYDSYYEKYSGQPGWWPKDNYHSIKSGDPAAVIVEANPSFRKSPNFSQAQENLAYKSNPYLDVNKDGKITLGDLKARIDEVKKLPDFQKLQQNLRSASNYKQDVSENKKIENMVADKDEGLIKILLNELNISDVTADSNFFEKLNNSLNSVANKKSDLIEVYGKDKYASAEFARVVGLNISRNYNFIPTVYSSNNKFQISLSEKIPQNMIIKICNQVNDELGVYKVRFLFKKQAEINLPELELESSQRLVRIFKLRNK